MEKLFYAWKNTEGTKSTKSLRIFKPQVKDISYVEFTVSGNNLMARGLNGSSDPYYVIKVPTEETKLSKWMKVALEVGEVGELLYHIVEYSITPYLIPFKVAHYAYEFASKTHPQTKGFKEVYKSSVVKNNLNPEWPTRKLGFFELCWGDVDLPILIEVYDWDRAKYSELIGLCFISLRELFYAKTTEIEIRDKKGKRTTGILKFNCIPSNLTAELPKGGSTSSALIRKLAHSDPTLSFNQEELIVQTPINNKISNEGAVGGTNNKNKARPTKSLRMSIPSVTWTATDISNIQTNPTPRGENREPDGIGSDYKLWRRFARSAPPNTLSCESSGIVTPRNPQSIQNDGLFENSEDFCT